jgi:hypothetical protein
MRQEAMTKPYRIILVCLLLVLTAVAGARAAPITGSNQPDATPDSAAAPAPQADAPAGGDDLGATVVEFSVLPSVDDPTQMETIVILQQGGGRRVCVNLKSSDVIARAYRKRGDEPFAPEPGAIRGLTSGHTGFLEGFNETRVFIRPDTPEDTFADPDECFVTGETEGCFIPDVDDCDQPLEEGDVACIMGTISRTGCTLADHTNLTRQMRILVTLNQPPGEEPIITAADVVGAPELPVPPEGPAGGLPGGPGPGGPTGEAPPGGGGGGSLVPVPNVIGLTLAEAEAAINAAGLRLGAVTRETVVASLGNPFIRSARAQVFFPDLCRIVERVCQQFPPPGILVALGSSVGVVLGVGAAAIPEPSSLVLFAMGLGLLILITWRRRRSS